MRFNWLFVQRPPIDELCACYETSRDLDRAGFIFHMSRCGSTLISQMLSAIPRSIVIAEAAPIDRLARAAWSPTDTRTLWLRWMVSAIAQKRTGAETDLFIKFDAATAVALPLVRLALLNVLLDLRRQESGRSPRLAAATPGSGDVSRHRHAHAWSTCPLKRRSLCRRRNPQRAIANICAPAAESQLTSDCE